VSGLTYDDGLRGGIVAALSCVRTQLSRKDGSLKAVEEHLVAVLSDLDKQRKKRGKSK
jgi:hypothetical protein